MHKYRILLSYARRQRGMVALIFLLTLLSSGLTALQPWPLKLLADHVLGHLPLPGWLAGWQHVLFRDPTSSDLVVLIILGGLVLFALNSLVETILTWAWTKGGRRMVYDLAEDLFARLQRRSLLFHSRNSVGDTMSRITHDCWSVYQVLDVLFFSPAHALLTIGAMVYLMAGLDGQLTLVSLAFAPFMVGASFIVTKPLLAAARLKREVESRIQSHIQQTLTGIPVVQAFAQEEREHLRFQKFADQVIEAQQRSLLAGSLNTLASGFVTVLGTGVILWLGAHHVLAGKLTVGGILIFLAYLATLQGQIKIFANIHNSLQGFQPSVARVVEVVEGAPEVEEKPGAASLARAHGAIRLDSVTFGYSPAQPVLRDLSFEILPGQTVAIVGSTGAGKSTLAGLIPRFFDPWAGRVLLDQKDVKDLRLSDLRRQVSLVLQEPFLFPLSIADNIAYGRPGASREEIKAAAKAANADFFIEQLPGGYETVLGERGTRLSGGERQRLSIARALLKNAPILILDEPTSALDSQTESVILEALQRLMSGRTTLVIAHRLSTIRSADRIIVLDAGRIAESGPHEELLNQGGLYAQLYLAQSEHHKHGKVGPGV